MKTETLSADEAVETDRQPQPSILTAALQVVLCAGLWLAGWWAVLAGVLVIACVQQPKVMGKVALSCAVMGACIAFWPLLVLAAFVADVRR